MKGIILAGGSGTRLYPLSKVVSKQLLPIYDKPLIYYPLSTLMLAGIRDILIISTDSDTPKIHELLGDGSRLGVRITYEIQPYPGGIAQAFIIGESFLEGDSSVLILGDNIYYGNGLTALLKQAMTNADVHNRATVFGYYAQDPQRFGVIEFDDTGKVISIEEKPRVPKSRYVITGLYFYPPRVSQVAKSLKPSLRGELEITDLNSIYLKKEQLDVQLLGRGYAWIDAGTIDSMYRASNFIYNVQQNQGIVISSPEEIAYINGFITRKMLLENSNAYGNSSYGHHLRTVADGIIKY